MYACQLWCKYTQTSVKRLGAAYNNAYRIMHDIPRNVSVPPHQVTHCVRTSDALLRNNLYRFFIQCASSSNFFIRSLQMSDAFYISSFFLNYSKLLYGGDQLQFLLVHFFGWLPADGSAGMDMCFACHRTILLRLSWTPTLARSAGSDPEEPHVPAGLTWSDAILTSSASIQPQLKRSMASSRESGWLFPRRAEGRRARDTMMMMIMIVLVLGSHQYCFCAVKNECVIYINQA